MKAPVSNKEQIISLCHTYVRLVADGPAGDFPRVRIHNKLLEVTHLDEDLLKEVLHNLDRWVGLEIEPWEEPWEISKARLDGAGRKLCEIIFDMMERQTYDTMFWNDEARKYLEERGITVEEWVEKWMENMEFDGELPTLDIPLINN